MAHDITEVECFINLSDSTLKWPVNNPIVSTKSTLNVSCVLVFLIEKKWQPVGRKGMSGSDGWNFSFLVSYGYEKMEHTFLANVNRLYTN